MTTFIEHIAGIADVAPDSIDEATAFRSLPAWDSLATLSLIVMYEDEYQLVVTNEQISRATTIHDLEALSVR